MISNMNYNRSKMLSYFQSGCKNEGQPLTFGLELEHFVINRISGKSLLYEGQNGVEALLKELSAYYQSAFYSEGHLIGLKRENITLSLEPAAQLEISISPQSDVNTIRRIYEECYDEITGIIEKWNCRLVTFGYQPGTAVDALQLIPKKRYEFMDRYFNNIGIYGKMMMRGTAATQVSIDYYNEEDFIKKYTAAFLLSDFFGILCRNTPYLEGRKTDNDEIPRYTIWENTDQRRVDFLGFLNGKNISFEHYMDFVMQTPVIVDLNNQTETFSTRTIGEICRERRLNEEEMEHMLSMVFPMVRLKNYLEIRFADSMPIDSVICYILLIKGFFTDIDETLSCIQKIGKGHFFIKGNVQKCLEVVYRHLNDGEREYVMQYQEEIENGTILK